MTTFTTTPTPFPATPTDSAYTVPSTRNAVTRKQHHMSHTTGAPVDRYRALTTLQTPYADTGRMVLTGGPSSNGLRAWDANSNSTYSASATINRMCVAGATIGAIKAAIGALGIVNPQSRLSSHLANLVWYGRRDQLNAAGCAIAIDATVPAALVANGMQVVERAHARQLAKRDDIVLGSPLLCVLHNVAPVVRARPDVVVRKASGKVKGNATAKAATAKAPVVRKPAKKAANG